MTFKILLLMLLFIRSFNYIKAEREKVDPAHHTNLTLEDPCDLAEFNRVELKECEGISFNLTPKECINKKCCFFGGKCFQKPIKCFMDVRSEKCYQNTPPPNTFKWIPGYSAHGTHCWSPHLAHFSKKKKDKFGVVDFKGIPISNDNNGGRCTQEYTIKITKTKKGQCSISCLNCSEQNERTSKWAVADDGVLYNDRICHSKNHQFYFNTPLNKPVKYCMCKIDCWLVYPKAKQVSAEMQQYLKTTKSEILQTFNETTFNKRVQIVNPNELKEMVSALDSISKLSTKISAYDTGIIVENIKKVVDYDIATYYDKTEADKLIQETVGFTNSLLENSLMLNTNNKKDKVHSLRNRRSLDTADDSYTLKMKLFNSFETITHKIATQIKEKIKDIGYESTIQQQSIDFRIKILNSRSIRKTSLTTHIPEYLNNNKTKEKAKFISLPIDQIDEADSVSAMSVFYRQPTDIKVKKEIVRASNYLSMQIQTTKNGKSERVSVPVEFTLSNNLKEKHPLTCGFLVENKQSETWSEKGCSVIKSSVDNTTCSCSHTTHFALLMKFSGSKLKDERFLEILSHSLGAISSLLLVATLTVFIRYREKLLRDRMLIHFHLILALLGGYISITLASFAITSQPVYLSNYCIVFAFLTHTFYLSVFFWSLIEGLYLFYKVDLVFQKNFLDRLIKLSPILGWFVPVLIAGTSLVVSGLKVESAIVEAETHFGQKGFKEFALGYVNPKTCFLNVSNGVIWTFLGPVLLVTFTNCILVIKVAVIIYRSTTNSLGRRNSDTESNAAAVRKSVKGAMFLMPILSIPWIIGLLYDLYEESVEGDISSEVREVLGITGAYLQVIFAGVQGILIFFFYCLYNSEVKMAHKLENRRKRSVAQGMKSSFRSTRTTTGRKLSSIFPWKTISRSESTLSGKSADLSTLGRRKTNIEMQNNQHNTNAFLGRLPITTFSQQNKTCNYSPGHTLPKKKFFTQSRMSTLER